MRCIRSVNALRRMGETWAISLSDSLRCSERESSSSGILASVVSILIISNDHS
jgi:hypothetical protein